MKEVEDLRHAQARGVLLKILAEDYAREMTTAAVIIGALDLQGYPVDADGLAWHLRYLEDSGYVRVWRNRDFGRRDRASETGNPDAIRFAKLLPRGVQLIDGDIAADPKVRF